MYANIVWRNCLVILTTVFLHKKATFLYHIVILIILIAFRKSQFEIRVCEVGFIRLGMHRLSSAVLVTTWRQPRAELWIAPNVRIPHLCQEWPTSTSIYKRRSGARLVCCEPMALNAFSTSALSTVQVLWISNIMQNTCKSSRSRLSSCKSRANNSSSS